MRKSGVGSFLALDLEVSEDDQPLFQRLYLQLRQAVLEGRLKPGTRLPASRLLADELGISRTTVITAYDQLASEGFLDLRQRSGVFVARDLPTAPSADPAVPSAVRPQRLGIRAEDSVGIGPIGVAPSKGKWRGCFVTGAPDASQFPFELWARLLARSWRRPAA